MNAQELHIDFDINLQKINSNATRNIEPREIDWLLNKETIKFLNKRTRGISDSKKKGFEEDTKRLKDVEPLIISEVLKVEQLVKEGTADTRNPELIPKGRFILPSFNFKNVSATCLFYKDCKESGGEDKERNVTIYKLKLPKEDFNDLKIIVNTGGKTNVLYTTDDLPIDYLNGEYIYLLKSFVISFRNKLRTIPSFKDIKIYYEWYAETYEEDTFFIIGGSTLDVSMIRGDEKIFIPRESKIIPFHISAIDITKPVRFVSHELVDWKLYSNLGTTLQESPIVTFNKGYGYAYFPKNIIIKSVKLTYICTPSLIDIDLGQSLNLDTDICAEIVAHTTRFTNALLESGNYKEYFNETNLIE